MHEAQLSLVVTLEAILFWKGEPVKKDRLAELAGAPMADIETALVELEKNLQGRGVQLIFNGDEIFLGTAAVAGPFIERLVKEELVKDLGKAGLETLAIILYRGPVGRRDIEYIRGVNCSYIIRNLLVRGLVERVEKKGERGAIYQPTTALLGYLGVARVSDLPEYATVQDEIREQQKAVTEQTEGETIQ